MLARRFSTFCLLLLLLLLTGCSTADPETAAIENVLIIRSNALNSRNIETYFTVISGQYRDKDKSISNLRENLEKNFNTFSQIHYAVTNRSITVNGINAEANGDYRMKVQVNGKEITMSGVEHLKLIKEPGGWKIISGI